MRTRVKICGITSAEDLALTVALGADAIGFNLFEGSARYINYARLCELAAQTAPFVTRVGLFVNPDPALVQRCAGELDILQFSGDESEAFCTQFGKPYIKAIRVRTEADVTENAYSYRSARALLLDARVEGQYGGTGETFDWRLAVGLGARLILAGGLTADNVADAIGVVHPFAVDVSSGVERERGKKDPEKLAAFVAAVRAADEVTR
ncbi:MAG: phosphoribosylanthranilate isomerase [Pseudomonadota bacterium]